MRRDLIARSVILDMTERLWIIGLSAVLLVSHAYAVWYLEMSGESSSLSNVDFLNSGSNLSNNYHHIYVTNSSIEWHKITSTLRISLIICH